MMGKGLWLVRQLLDGTNDVVFQGFLFLHGKRAHHAYISLHVGGMVGACFFLAHFALFLYMTRNEQDCNHKNDMNYRVTIQR